MPKGSSPYKTANAILGAIAGASRTYEKLTNGDWLDWAPEYFVTVEIARKLGKEVPVSLEVSTVQTMQSGAAKGKGKHHKVLDGLKRFDIVCYEKTGDQLPRAIVEVKHPYYGVIGRLENDIKRIAVAVANAAKKRVQAKNDATKRRASLRHGFLAFYALTKTPKKMDGSADERLDRWIKAIEKKAVIGNPGVVARGHKKLIRNEDNAHAYAVVITLTAPPPAVVARK